MKRIFQLIIIFIIGINLQINAQSNVLRSKKIQVELLGSYTTFEQQAKSEIGGVKGDLLASYSEFNVQLEGKYNLWKFLNIGWFFQYDIGNRNYAKFDRFDASGKTITSNKVGGDFKEFWSGPSIGLDFDIVFLNIGYGLFGSRKDLGRNAILDANGNSLGNFKLSPVAAWRFDLGTAIKIKKDYFLIIKAQYRIRYYNSRDNISLKDNAVLGTQNFTPLIGIQRRF